jgi:hypothetical protein
VLLPAYNRLRERRLRVEIRKYPKAELSNRTHERLELHKLDCQPLPPPNSRAVNASGRR